MTRKPAWPWLWGLLCLPGCATAAAPGSPGVASSPARALDDDGLGERLTGFGEVLRGQGFVETAFRARGFLPPSARETQPVHVPAGTCALFVALASPTVDDLDAAVYTSEGQVLVEDEGSDARPVLTLCTGARPLSLYYSVHAYQGAGAFVARVFERPRTAEDSELAIEDEVQSDLSSQMRELHKRGFQDDAPPVALALGQAPVRVAVPVVSGECYSLLAQAEALGPVTMRLLGPAGQEVALGVTEGNVAALQHCARETADYGLELGAGAGAVTFARLHAPQSAIGGARALWLGEPSPSDHAFGAPPPTRKAVQTALQAEGARLALFETFPLEQGRIRELSLARTTSRCERLQVSLHAGLSSAHVRVEAQDGTTLGEANVPAAGASLSLCERRAPARVVVTGLLGFGSVTLVNAALAR